MGDNSHSNAAVPSNPQLSFSDVFEKEDISFGQDIRINQQLFTERASQFYAELARKAMHQLYEIGNLLPQKFNFIACDGKIYDRIYFLENYIFKGLPKDRSVPTSGGNETQLLFIQDSIFVRLGFVIDRIAIFGCLNNLLLSVNRYSATFVSYETYWKPFSIKVYCFIILIISFIGSSPMIQGDRTYFLNNTNEWKWTEGPYNLEFQRIIHSIIIVICELIACILSILTVRKLKIQKTKTYEDRLIYITISHFLINILIVFYEIVEIFNLSDMFSVAKIFHNIVIDIIMKDPSKVNLEIKSISRMDEYLIYVTEQKYKNNIIITNFDAKKDDFGNYQIIRGDVENCNELAKCCSFFENC
ncbi:unnamed protein product [Caenorhabditis angaria]|uniref:Serpentine receptor class gamma n=1 Tax=Caenorhabditis angaria TaxID=860376 RepID=A0A9P1IDZ9_9PELO|nr:unnamed protein product [Caenorhabditis angaria]